MKLDIISIFPDYFAPLELSLIGKACTDGLLEVGVHDLRDWTHDRHRTVDDTPYGGGAGMVMMAEPWAQALESVLGPGIPSPAAAADSELDEGHEAASAPEPTAPESSARPVLIFPSPSGHVFTQQMAEDLATRPQIAFACGRYEGIDHRVIEWASERYDVREVSIGDYVLNGGEVATLVMIEAIVRLIPGVIGNPESLIEESHSTHLAPSLEYPLYTKPATWRGYEVPEILLSGHHAKIAAWRANKADDLTRERRPDLWERRQ